jgi:hypothetical protein
MSIACRFIAFAALIGLVGLFVGCGPSGPKTIPVSGKVTLNGGPLPGPGFIYFTTEGGSVGTISRPGTAELAADGAYKAKTFTDGDGLLPGKYLLRVECAMKSELELTVPADKPSLVHDFDLKSQ